MSEALTDQADQKRLQQLDQMLTRSSSEGRQRLATYLRRYMSPLVIEQLFEQEQLGVLTEEREVERATVIIADVRGFTPQTLQSERSGRGMRSVVELLEQFFNDATETVFEYGGVMGEFSGDKFIAVFGIPFPKPDDADRAVLAAIDIYESAVRLNRPLRMTRRHQIEFEVGIGIHTGGPIWIGDIGAGWRRELSMIGTTINVASRVEELTKATEFVQVHGYNILLTQTCIDSLSAEIRDCLTAQGFPIRQLRGLGEEVYRLNKLLAISARPPVLRSRIDWATRSTVDAIAQMVESIREREDRGRLQQTIQDIGRTITSSLELQKILESVLDEVQRFLNATTASLLLIEEGTNRLRFKAVRPRENLAKLKLFDLVLGKGIVGHVAQNGKSLILGDAQADPRFYSQPDRETKFQTRSVLCAPIYISENVIGVIQVIDDKPDKFTIDDLQTLESIASFAASAIYNARQHEVIAEVDTLMAMSVVTSDIAHRIKNDVGLILLTANRIIEKLDQAKQPLDLGELHKKMKGIRQSAETTLNMMEEVRDPFSRIKHEEVNLREVLEEAVRSALENAGTHIEVKRNYNEVPIITNDKRRLAQVFHKVLENAIEAMQDSNSKILSLDLWWEPKESRVRLGIADTGPGIPEELRSKLFRPITKAKNDQAVAHHSWGYGLWSSRLFLRNMGGTIYLDDVYSQGARFLIDLPKTPPSQSLAEEAVDEVIIVDEEPEEFDSLISAEVVDNE